MQKILACLFLLSALTACGGETRVDTDIKPSSSESEILPKAYQTISPTKTHTIISPMKGIILPTPTVFSYTIIEGDTLIGIAGRYGVTQEALLSANPSLQPSALSVGTTIIIPSSSDNPGDSLPTPAPLAVQQDNCWPETDGGLWCFALVQNRDVGILENISIQFSLVNSSGHVLASQVSYAMLNTLPSGQSMPLAIHFPPPVQADVKLQVWVLTATRLLPGDTRYLPVMIENIYISVDSPGQTAQVNGRVILNGVGTANTLWVLATAFDDIGNVVGVRRWESPSPLSADSPISFDFQVSSAGPVIDRVEFLAEARP